MFYAAYLNIYFFEGYSVADLFKNENYEILPV